MRLFRKDRKGSCGASKCKRRRAVWPLRAAWLLAVLLAAAGAQSGWAQASAPCRGALAEAEQFYRDGAFDAAAQAARRCLRTDRAATSERVQAYRLLSLAALREDDEPAARDAAAALLRTAPRYAPDPVQDPPAYVTLVADVKEQLRAVGALPAADASPKKPWFERRTTWLVVGAGLVVTGLAAIFAGSR